VGIHTIEITRERAAEILLGHHGLDQLRFVDGASDLPALLAQLRCIQLDPLDPIGTNADLVALARIDGLKRGDVYGLLGGHAFEHFAKERCLIPSYAFPYYRDQAVETPWWRLTDRLKRLSEETIDAVADEVASRGPVTAADLTDHGAVRAIDWSGWKGTSKATSMAIEVLWTRCRVVVCGRSSAGKLYDIPARALPQFADAPASGFGRFALLERVHAAGLLSRATGPLWSMLRDVRTGPVVGELLASGELCEITVAGSRRTYLTTPEILARPAPTLDERMRILGPLDPMIWDRKLVQHVFDFEYIWEVYKPASKRRWGWYVCPLLHHGRLVGRFEARVNADVLDVSTLWVEPGVDFDRSEFERTMERHARACSAGDVRYSRGAR
jgi:uncharacterized protein YcaQ